MHKILIGTAAFAIAAMTATYSLPAEAQGRDNGNGKGDKAEQSQKRDKGNDKKAERGDRGPQMQASDNGHDNDKKDYRGNDKKDNRGSDRVRTADFTSDRVRGNGNNGNETRRDDRDRDYYRADDRYRDNDSPFYRLRDRDGNFSLIDGCPPGLAKKNNGCLPPGQAKKQGNFGSNWFDFDGLRDARYRDGYLVRYGDNGISGYFPLLGGALSVGERWPGRFGVSEVPDYYRSYYNLGEDYRYYGNTLYRLNPETAAITSIAALITGDDIAVGQPMPTGYDVYNVPMGYRDRYSDGPDAAYRYSDGYIYQVDPATKLVAAAIELLI